MRCAILKRSGFQTSGMIGSVPRTTLCFLFKDSNDQPFNPMKKKNSKNRKPEARTYKKDEDLQQVEKWMVLYPWYRQLVHDIRYTLAQRDKRCRTDYRVIGLRAS